MKINGAIRPAREPAFDRPTWCDFITKRPEFRRPPARQGINPFTKKPVTLHPRDDAAEIWLDGQLVGHAEWSQSDQPLVNISAESSALALVTDWAIALGGEFIPSRPEPDE